MNNDYSYSYEWDQRYCYPHSNVLINKLGIEDAEKLHIAESEINVLHPFREGNGRAQRLFIEYLAENAGYSVDFSQVTDRQMIEASADSFLCDYTKMNEIFAAITKPLQENTMTQIFMG